MQRIPRGVADDRLAVVGTRAGVLVALDSRTGAVRWRGGRGLRPCAITARSVVAVRVGDPDGPGVVVLDSEDGREQWAAAFPIGPSWARRAVAQDPTSSLDCTVDDGEVLIRWRASTAYEGGAAPSADVREQHRGQTDGAVRVDLRARSVDPASPSDLTSDPASTGAGTEAPPARGGLAADVVDAGHVGGIRVELATPPTGSVVLRGVDEAADTVLWEVVLEEQESRPPPLRH